MKLTLPQSKRSSHRQNGFAVLICLAFLVLISMLCIATMHTVTWSRSEVASIEKYEVARLAATTNTPPISNPIGMR